MLAELFEKYGSDKESSKHSYAKVYEELVGDRRGSITSVLEVGILGGASLRAWRDYFPKAQIFGVDVDPGKMFSDDRIMTFTADSTKADELAASLGSPAPIFDLIVDDGDHHPDKQWPTRLNMWPYLRVGGVYVIEDVQWIQALHHFEERGGTGHDMRHLRPGSWDNMMCHWVKDK